jgi:hypothetical protein
MNGLGMSTAAMLELFLFFDETGGALGPYRHFIKTNNRTQIRELHASLTNRHFIKTNNCSYARTSCFYSLLELQSILKCIVGSRYCATAIVTNRHMTRQRHQ